MEGRPVSIAIPYNVHTWYVDLSFLIVTEEKWLTMCQTNKISDVSPN